MIKDQQNSKYNYSFCETIFLNLSSDDDIAAIFESDTLIDHIYLNEVCASNESNVSDDYGQKEDWVEIYNHNDFDVNLSGWYLSDSSGNETQYQIPSGYPELTTIKAKDYLARSLDLLNAADEVSRSASFERLELKFSIDAFLQQCVDR